MHIYIYIYIVTFMSVYIYILQYMLTEICIYTRKTLKLDKCIASQTLKKFKWAGNLGKKKLMGKITMIF